MTVGADSEADCHGSEADRKDDDESSPDKVCRQKGSVGGQIRGQGREIKEHARIHDMTDSIPKTAAKIMAA